MKLVRRTFEAAKLPKGSTGRDILNQSWKTSEYMPSYRYGIEDDQGRCAKQFRTKREAELYLQAEGGAA